jgi:hypothetical protein
LGAGGASHAGIQGEGEVAESEWEWIGVLGHKNGHEDPIVESLVAKLFPHY